MELHPRLDPTNLNLSGDKIILGSFPVWSLTAGKNPAEIALKEQERDRNKDFHFFYGSSNNLFWTWYQRHFDTRIIINDPESIQSSLTKNGVGITDMILSCERKDKSALDKHLTKRVYNHEFLTIPSKGTTTKILCTSKGVLNEMFLHKKIYLKYPNLSINAQESEKKQVKFLKQVKGSFQFIKKPFFRSLEFPSSGTIECLALPSPGSPYRRLIDFGAKKEYDRQEYLSKYLEAAFSWFKS
jgi:hypothetical protein